MQNLDSIALILLDFAQQSVSDAIANPSMRQEPLREAEAAIRALYGFTRRADQTKRTQLMMLDFHEFDLQNELNTQPTNQEAALRFVFDRIRAAKEIFR